MIKINWKKNYNGEFICPKCEKGVMRPRGTGNGKKRFKCASCNCCQYCCRDINKTYFDSKTKSYWIYGQYIDDFECPNCRERNIRLYNVLNHTKRFKCKSCNSYISDSVYISRQNISQYAHQKKSIKPFNFDDDTWDLRSICSIGNQDNNYMIFFSKIKQEWVKYLVKKYIHHLCKLNTSLNTIGKHMTSMRFLSRYLLKINITDIQQINRSIILDFLASLPNKESIKNKLWTLREFFTIGTLQEWFVIDQDIIRSEDYPKRKRTNPDPISDTVREQIEKHLHKLPDPIARMWIITFFTAMRPSELALLKKDCLVQEGANWKIVWNRKKGKDQHEVPITRLIAKVVQEQLEYINNLWGDSWDYLYCHYQGISASIQTQPKIKPERKVIPVSYDPLNLCIRCLIKAENIRDENGFLAKFQTRLIRATRLTQLYEQGHDLAVVSAWGGHKNFATTSLHYTKVSTELIEKEAGHIQKALFNASGRPLYYESLPKSFWDNPTAHKLDLPSDHINTPIYGYCGLALDKRCDKFRACYTCACFVATNEKLAQYKKVRNELREKESNALNNGHDVLVELFGKQALQLDQIIEGLEGAT